MNNLNNFKLNPCSATMKVCEPNDINCINNKCFETLGAFENASSLNQIRNLPQSSNCNICVENAKAVIGKDDCDLRLTDAPIFNQTPHYFPNILRYTQDPEKSKDMCFTWCNDCKNCKNECKDNCRTDYNTVEKFKQKDPIRNSVIDYSKTNPVSFYTALALGLIFFAIILYIFIKGIRG